MKQPLYFKNLLPPVNLKNAPSAGTHLLTEMNYFELKKKSAVALILMAKTANYKIVLRGQKMTLIQFISKKISYNIKLLSVTTTELPFCFHDRAGRFTPYSNFKSRVH